MAAKIIANLIVMGSGIIIRAFAQAYRQALATLAQRRDTIITFIWHDFKVTSEGQVLIADASKTGVAQETLQNVARRAGKVMTEEEARKILGVTEQSSWEEILQKYDNLFESNAKSGSFYLQSKVHRAKECLENAYQVKNEGSADDDT